MIVALLPGAKRSPFGSPFPPVTIALPLANCHAPVPTDPTTRRNLKQRVPPDLLSLPMPQSRLHGLYAPSPSLHSRTDALTHIRGSSPILRTAALLPFPAPCAAPSFYRQVRPPYPGSHRLSRREHHRLPLLPQACSRQRRPRTACRALVPAHLAGYSTTRCYYAGSAGVLLHPALHSSALATAGSIAQAAPPARGGSYAQPPVR